MKFKKGSKMVNKVQGNRNAKFRNGNKNRVVSNGIKKKVVGKPKVQDARQKIVQKKRTTVVDARDVLAKIAKTQDARSKLNKIREVRGGKTHTNNNVKVIGHNIVQKTDRNGKISLSTNKPKPKSEINMTIQKQLGIISGNRTSPKKVVFKRNAAVNTQRVNTQRVNTQRENIQRRNPVNLRKTIINQIDLAPLDARLERMERLYDRSLYKWQNPEVRTATQLINTLEPLRPRSKANILSNGWTEYIPKVVPRLAPAAYVDLDAMDEDEEMALVPPLRQTISLQGSSRVSDIYSRLDSHPSQPESHGIFSQAKTKVVVPVGHRIVVSNLQSTVTQDDIKELFEDIGQLLAARLVRPGVAEVIYKNLKDAQKAVDTYHNRQLDGQPMKCLLYARR
ncbi:unnamed protein product [Brassicogethes aeneus]|uniref:RRM domain-containing protein n=1 Tax=Brassicogethes aeneus TaxID=1431903 RepID=A0A9P0B458_BRAAE|nr:unnamed protein product [Brassicogethes aeneus]